MDAWSFSHPGLLAGLLAAALPLLIHLIGRRRAAQQWFAAFDFLMAVNRRLARRERLRQLLLLLARTLALVALVLAVARPAESERVGNASTERRLALVVDASASMAYMLDGQSLLSRAKQQARELLSHLQPGDAVCLAVAGSEARLPLGALTYDHAAVRAAVDAIAVADGVADLGGAIDKTLAALGDDGHGVTLAVVTDLAANSFAALLPAAMQPPPTVRLIDAAGRERPVALGNLAVEGLRVENAANSAAERRFVIRLRNYGDTPVNGRVVELAIGDAVRQRGYADVPARAAVEKTMTLAFDEPGLYRGVIRLVGDAADGFTDDDWTPFVVDVAAGVRVLVLNGDPRTTPYEDELFFAERALEAVPEGEAPIDVQIVAVDELGTADPGFSGYDVVVAANVGELPESVVGALRKFVDGGHGLLFALGDRVAFERANQVFGDLFPHPLRDLHQAEDAHAGTPALGLGEMDWDHPVLEGLGPRAEDSLRASRTARYFHLDVGASRRARVLMHFDNGAPALVEALRDGPGRVMMLTTSLDLDMSDLAIRTVFPALLQRLAHYLASASVGGAAVTAVASGGSVDIALPTGARGLAITDPDGARVEIFPARQDERRVHIAMVKTPGVHEAAVLRASGWERAAPLDLPVGPSLAESDFQPAASDVIAAALTGTKTAAPVPVVVGSGGGADPFAASGAAATLLLAVCLLFVGESLLAARG